MEPRRVIPLAHGILRYVGEGVVFVPLQTIVEDGLEIRRRLCRILEVELHPAERGRWLKRRQGGRVVLTQLEDRPSPAGRRLVVGIRECGLNGDVPYSEHGHEIDTRAK